MIYECKCETCGRTEDIYRSVEERNNTPECCGKPMKRIITGYHVIGDLEPYLDENMTHEPQWVKSKQHRKQLMKEHGVTEKYGKGWQ